MSAKKYTNTLEGLNNYLLDKEIDHFKAHELCKVHSLGVMNLPPQRLWRNCLQTLTFLEFLRLKFGPIRVISGYRSPENNRKVEGAKHSQHMEFRAIDSAPIKGSLSEYKKYVRKFWKEELILATKEVDFFWHHHFSCKVYPHEMGIGAYTWGVHVDFGYKKREWLGSGAKW